MTPFQALVRDMKTLKPLPAITQKVLELAGRDDTNMGDIAQVIQYDPFLTADILKACNSAVFGLKQPAESMGDAVTLLGMDQIVELVLIKSAGRILDPDPTAPAMEKELWRAAVASALITKHLARELGMDHRNALFTSALLKDIGKTLVQRFLKDHHNRIQELIIDKGMAPQAAEKKVIGVDHAELGAMIGKLWKFPPRMIRIIRHHHMTDPIMRRDRDVALVHLADCICAVMGLGHWAPSEELKDQTIIELGIPPRAVSSAMADFNLRIQEVDDLLTVV